MAVQETPPFFFEFAGGPLDGNAMESPVEATSIVLVRSSGRELRYVLHYVRTLIGANTIAGTLLRFVPAPEPTDEDELELEIELE